MRLLQRLFAAWLLGLAGVLAGCASPSLVEGRDYVVLDTPQPTAGGMAIEVSEFIWFGCPHCADMHPRMETWKRNQPADVAVRIRPVVFRDSWSHGARLHYTLEAMGEMQARAGAVFEAVQLDDLDLGNEEAVVAWAIRQGLDRERFLTAYRSPGVQSRIAEAVRVAQDYQLTGVPSFVVDGRYLTSNRLSGSAQDTLAIVDRLIVKSRAERQSRRP